MQLIGVKRIWDSGAHNAFTDLVSFKGALFCVFREGSAHVSHDGSLRIIKSLDKGQSWHSVALIASNCADLRDGKLLEFKGELLLLGGGALYDRHTQQKKGGLQSFVWRSIDGAEWSSPIEVADPNYWLWRVTEHQGVLYGAAYRAGPDGDTRLYRSEDGSSFDTWVQVFNNQGYVNESSIVFEKETAYCLLRRDPVWGPEYLGLLGQSTAPFTNWHWLELDRRIGGPVLFQYQSRLLAIVRLYEGNLRTSLVEIHRDSGKVDELLTLPSEGDTSYAGIVL